MAEPAAKPAAGERLWQTPAVKKSLCLWLLVAACADGGVSGPGGDTGASDAADALPVDGGMDVGFRDVARVDAGELACRDGEACNADDDGCTMDICRDGECVSEGPVDCDDSIACTVDRCVASSSLDFACEHDAEATSCFIEGACHAAGDPNPGMACEACEPATSTSGWSAARSGTCDDGDACTTADVCTAEGCVGVPTGDMYEPNDTRASAERLPNVSDRDSYPKATILPSLFPDSDEDWFVFHDSDDFGGLIFPRASMLMPLGVDLDVCIYVDCDSTFVDRSCTNGTEVTLGGLQGCCGRTRGSTAENVRLDHNCSGGDDSADIYVQVTRVSGSMACDESYTLDYGDD